MSKLKDDNIIQFNEIKSTSVQKKNKTYHDCEHKRVYVSEDSPYLECRDCGKDLDPIWFLRNLATKENYAKCLYESLKRNKEDLEKKISEMNKFHCEHCKRFSRIDRSIWVTRNG